MQYHPGGHILKQVVTGTKNLKLFWKPSTITKLYVEIFICCFNVFTCFVFLLIYNIN